MTDMSSGPFQFHGRQFDGRQFDGQRRARSFSIAIYLYEPSDGGLDRVAILLANHLVARGVNAELWMARTDGPLAGLIDPTVRVRKVPSPSIARRQALVAQIPVIAAMVRRFRPDILYSAGNQSNMLVALAALGSTTHAVGRISNPIARPGDSPAKVRIRHWRFRTSARLSAMTIVMGEHDRAVLADGDAGLARKISLLPRPTVTPVLEQAGQNRSPAQAGGRSAFLAVGRLAPQKDHDTMLAALARLKHRDWHLRIAGQGPLLGHLQQRCRDLSIADRVEFLGFIDQPDALARLYGTSDLLLQSSRFEGFCGAILEALACGCGVVATASSPNMRSWLDKAGQQPMVPIGDADAFAAAIDRAMAASVDRDRMIEAVRPLRVETALDAHIAAFTQLCRTADERCPSPRVDAFGR